MSNGLHRNDPESLVRAAAEGFSALPGEEVWKGIEQAIRKKDKRKRFVWLFILPVILIPAILLMGKPFQTKDNKTSNETAYNNSTVNKTNTEQTTEPSPVKTSVPVINTIPASASPKAVNGAGETITQPQATKQNSGPVMLNNKPATTHIIPKASRQNNPENNITEHNQNNHIQPVAKQPARIKNRISQKTTTTPASPKVSAKQEDLRATAATSPVETEPIEQVETIETKQEPVASTTTQANEPENKLTQETAVVQPEKNRPEENKPVNPKNDALNQKPVFPTVTVELPRRKFKLGFTVSAGGGYRLLAKATDNSKMLINASPSIGNPPPADSKAIKSLNHRPAFVFGAGAIASLPLSNNWSLEAGVEYQMLGYNMPAYKTTPVQVNYSSGGVVLTTVPLDLNSRYVSDPSYANTSVAGKKTLKNQYHFINVPVTAVYESNPFGKRSFYVKAGVAVNYLLNKDAYIYSAESRRYFISPTPETYRNLNVAGVLEGGVRLILKNNNELRVGMNFGFNLLPTHNKDITLREYLYQSGIKISYLLR